MQNMYSVCTCTKLIPWVASSLCCILDLSMYSLSAPLLNPVVTRSDSVLSDDRPTAISFCSALCLPGVALVGALLVVHLKWEIKIILFKFCESKILHSYISIYASCLLVPFTVYGIFWGYFAIFVIILIKTK